MIVTIAPDASKISWQGRSRFAPLPTSIFVGVADSTFAHCSGVGGIFNQNNIFTRVATVGNAHVFNRSGAQDEVLGDGGLGLEYRFTPHIGLFSDVRYNVVNRSKNNFLSTRFGLRFAF